MGYTTVYHKHIHTQMDNNLKSYNIPVVTFATEKQSCMRLFPHCKPVVCWKSVWIKWGHSCTRAKCKFEQSSEHNCTRVFELFWQTSTVE